MSNVPEFREYGYKFEPDTCRWCGRRLKRVNAKLLGGIRHDWQGQGDGFFCGLRCGYQFALYCLRGKPIE